MKLPHLRSMWPLVPMVAQLTPAEALPMFMALMAARLTPAVVLLTLMALMVVRLITIMIRTPPTLMEPMAAKLIPMMARERRMERTVEQLPGVMVAAPLIVPMAARLIGVMVPDLPKVRGVVQRVGVMVPERQRQRADKPEVGAGKHFTVQFYRFFSHFHISS